MKTATLAMLGLFIPVALFPADRPFDESTTVVAVEVPVEVSVNGQPVRGLKQENFELYDGRDKQQITGFDVVDVSPTAGAAAAEAATPIAARRHFLMLFDLANSEPPSILRARRAAADVVGKLQPSDLVGVATYSKARGPQLLLGFTADRKQVAIALDSLGLVDMFERSGDPLVLAAADLEAQFSLDQVGQPTNRGANEGRGAAEALDSYRDAARAADKADRANHASEADAFTQSMAGMAQMMSSVSGRKYVVLLSEGFNNQLLTGEETQDQETQDARENGEVWKIDSDKQFGSSQVQNNLGRMVEEFRRADCVIQSVDIGGLKAGGDQGNVKASGRETLFTMAKDTGGELYEHFNDLSQAMGQMLDRTSVTYLLTFQPQDLKSDGKYRRLSVKLKNVPRGAAVSFRPGYYAPKPFAQLTALERRLRAADLVMGGEVGGQIPTSVLAVAYDLGGAKAYVPVVIEIDGKTLLAGTTGQVAAVEIYSYALDKKGSVAGFIAQSLGLDLAKVRTPLEANGLKFFGHIDLPPGEYTLRTVVRNGQTGAHAVDVQRLPVPVFAGGPPAVSQPLFAEAPGRWMPMREPVKEGKEPPPYPFVAKDQPFIPSAGVHVSAQSESPVCVLGYNLGDAALAAQTEMTDQQGNLVTGGRLKITQRVKSASGADRLLGTFQAQGVAPGRYHLKLLLKVGDATVESPAIDIEVTAAAAGAP